MDAKILYDKVEEIEYLTRYFNLIDSDDESILKAYTKVVGQMAEAHARLCVLMDEIKAEIEVPKLNTHE